MANILKEKANTNEILRKWLASKKKTIAQFNRDMGFWSNYAYQLLSPVTPREITYDTIGRLLVAYGEDGPALRLAEHMRAMGWPINDHPARNGKARQ